jgi:hypothetical protein
VDAASRPSNQWCVLASASIGPRVQPSALPTSRSALRGAVADDHGGQRGAVAAVLGVDVLDDLLAPLVLEVDVDVGRLVALAADEALEQQRHARRVDLGDAQAVADRRVGRRAAALAQDARLRAKRTMSCTVRK